MFCPNCCFQMMCIQRFIDEKQGITRRIYECQKTKCNFKGVVETCEAVGRSSNTKHNLTRLMAAKMKAAMRKVAKEMRAMKHENLTDLETQALKFAAGWIDRKNL